MNDFDWDKEIIFWMCNKFFDRQLTEVILKIYLDFFGDYLLFVTIGVRWLSVNFIK